MFTHTSYHKLCIWYPKRWMETYCIHSNSIFLKEQQELWIDGLL